MARCFSVRKRVLVRWGRLRTPALSNAARMPLFRGYEFAREIAHGIPGCGEADRENGDEHQQYVRQTDAHGIGFDNEVAAIAKAQEAELHL